METMIGAPQKTRTLLTALGIVFGVIMNIVLATALERTREIGIRRSIGARRWDIVRHLLTESVMISVGGGLLGIAFGFFLAWLIAQTAEWKTIVTTASV
jgi:putative ABC transport system permease protein